MMRSTMEHQKCSRSIEQSQQIERVNSRSRHQGKIGSAGHQEEATDMSMVWRALIKRQLPANETKRIGDAWDCTRSLFNGS